MGNAVRKATKTEASVMPEVEAVVENINTATENTEETSKIPGRPVDMNSERQKRLVEQAMKKLLNGGDLKRGRPSNPDSARQQKIKQKDPNAKPGRPKMSEEDKAKNAELKKQNAENEKKRIAELAKQKLAAANALNEDGSVKTGITKEDITSILAA